MEKPLPRLDDHPAWQQAWRLRCCPPDQVLQHDPDLRLQEHLELCPWCRECMKLPLCPVPEADTVTSLQVPPVPGQLYALNPKLAGWGPKARYYNPPIVLVLAIPDALSVFVCQTYGDQAFAGPDDTNLEPAFPGFAQPWNCYTLMQTNLGILLGTVDEQVVKMLEQRVRQDLFSPQPGSLLWFFRQMEVETGFFFSSQAVTQLLAFHENDAGTSFTHLDRNRLMEDLHHLPIRLTGIDAPALSPVDLLCRAEPDPHSLPLAAADAEMDFALAFTLENGTLTAVETQQITISFCEYANGLLTVTGSLASLPSGSHSWIFRWQTSTQLIEPLSEHSGHDGLLFWTAFSLSPELIKPPAHLLVRILVEDRE